MADNDRANTNSNAPCSTIFVSVTSFKCRSSSSNARFCCGFSLTARRIDAVERSSMSACANAATNAARHQTIFFMRGFSY